MYQFLGWFALAIGLFVSVVLIWELYQIRRAIKLEPDKPFVHHLLRLFSQWTWLDTALTVLFVMGMMFLLADLLAVWRERDLYPYYRFGYLLSSFVYMLLGALFLWTRLFIIMRYGDVVPLAPKASEQTKIDPSDQTTDTEHSTNP